MRSILSQLPVSSNFCELCICYFDFKRKQSLQTEFYDISANYDFDIEMLWKDLKEEWK